MATFPVAAGTRITAALINHSYALGDSNVTTVTAAALTDLSSVYTIAASDAAVGTVYRLTAAGNGVWGSTQQALTVGFFLGGSALGVSPVIAATAFAASDVFRWAAVATAICSTTGASGTWHGSLVFSITDTTLVSVGQSAGNVTVADANSGGLTKDTTASQTFSIRAGWAATTGAPTISCKETMFERCG